MNKEIKEEKLIEYQLKLEEYENEILKLQQQYSLAMAVLQQKDEYLEQSFQLCNYYATGKLAKLNHFAFRLKNQLFNGNKEQKKAFWKWTMGRIRKTNRSIGDGAVYNPWMIVGEKLKAALLCRVPSVTYINTNIKADETILEEPINDNQNQNDELSENLKSILAQKYTKYDVIILSVIDYKFRHQRPQHFATRFAKNGHRVFYVNANFIRPDSIVTELDNLHIVDWYCEDYNTIYAMDGKSNLEWMKEKFDKLIYEEGIRDAVVIVDYPNWVYAAKALREHYGFKIVTDYMDDYTGFLGTTEDFLKNNCIELLSASDAVIASSQFLYDVAVKYTDTEKITIVRNGTEVEHFYQAIHLKNRDKKRKVVGYYGAVAHWFAWDKVCYIAEKFPEHDIVIVGDVTEYREKLERHSNIKLLGEKPYKELPSYLADFDVCLIPFDTSTDLIKATNPVKFYEYLSAGKKIVATEIPELMPFRDEYVYMSNDNEKFAEYVKMCLDETDSLNNQEECIMFARDNDWQKRFEAFEFASSLVIPKVSIIVLTYNNLEMNKKCINSILQKTAYANYELIIVDNKSTDGTTDYLKELQKESIPNVKIILNQENLGFAGGNNLGIQEADGKYVLLLNNDTVVTRGWLTSMTKHLENNAHYGMCNPVTNSIGNESMIKVHYHNEAELEQFAYIYTSKNMNEEFLDVDRLPLFATLIRKSVIDEVGMLDTRYKVGMFEDDDFTNSVKAAGYDIVIVEDAFIHHVNNASFKKLNDDEYKKIFETNKAIYEQKWKKKWTMPKYRPGVTATDNVDCGI